METAVSRAIDSVDRDTGRSVRRALSLARMFTSDGYQSALLDQFAAVLADGKSVYYRLVRELVDQVNAETLKTFSVNLAYGGWSNGSRVLRERGAALGCALPWIITIDQGAEKSPALTRRLVDEAYRLGIVCFILQWDQGLVQPDLALLRERQDCAFLLMGDISALPDTALADVNACHNAMFAIPRKAESFAADCARLSRLGCLFGLYHVVPEQGDICGLSDEAQQYLCEQGCHLLILRDEQCPPRIRAALRAQVQQIRYHLRHPLGVFHVASDVAEVNRVISGLDCSVHVSQSGRLGGYDLRGKPLAAVLQALFPLPQRS